MWNSTTQRGFTLIEMIISIIILSIALAGVLITYNITVRGSADALVSKQLVAIAEEMMEEVLLKPFVPPAGSAVAGTAGGACAGPGTAADRSAFDEVGDYNNYQTPDICDIDGNAVPGLNGYSVTVLVLADNTLGIGAANTLRVTVTAARGGETMVLDGFKVLLPP